MFAHSLWPCDQDSNKQKVKTTDIWTIWTWSRKKEATFLKFLTDLFEKLCLPLLSCFLPDWSCKTFDLHYLIILLQSNRNTIITQNNILFEKHVSFNFMLKHFITISLWQLLKSLSELFCCACLFHLERQIEFHLQRRIHLS